MSEVSESHHVIKNIPPYDFNQREDPENLIIPLELGKTLYQEWDADLTIFDKPD